MDISFNLTNGTTIVFSLVGLFFFFAGTLGLLRFPDTLCRLHALTKADNLGLGFIVLALLPQMNSAFDMLQLLLIWLLVMAASAASCFLIANYIRLVSQSQTLPREEEI